MTEAPPRTLGLLDLATMASRGRYLPAKHLSHLAKHLERVAGGRLSRLQINMPPRHGKTRLAAQMFPLWYLLTYPDREILYSTHSMSYAATAGEAVRDMMAEIGPHLAGVGVSPRRKASGEWALVDSRGRHTGGGMVSVGLGQSIHGRGAHLLITDDLTGHIEDAVSLAYRDKVHRWFTSTASTRLAPGGAVVNIGTPFTSDDLFARLEKAEGEGGDKWTRVRLPALAKQDDPLQREEGAALWPERFPVEALVAKREAMKANGEYRDWRAQYDLEPVSGDGVSEWPEEYFRDVLVDDYPDTPWALSVLSVDPSKGARAQKKGDWQAFTNVKMNHQGRFWTEAQFHRLDFAGLCDKTEAFYQESRAAAVVIETNNMGYALWETMVKKRLPAFGREHTGQENKLNRISIRLGRALEAGWLRFIRGGHTQILLDQLRFFPNADYDDGPDSLEMGLEFCGEYFKRPAERRVVYKTPLSPH